jgi:diguanylate cyclase (GGDEF)-like protein/PAS domain S-box-containing protein
MVRGVNLSVSRVESQESRLQRLPPVSEGEDVTDLRDAEPPAPPTGLGRALGSVTAGVLLTLFVGLIFLGLPASWDPWVVGATLVALASCLLAAGRASGAVRWGWASVGVACGFWGAALLAALDPGAPQNVEVVLRSLAYLGIIAGLLCSPGVRRSMHDWLLLFLDGWMYAGSALTLAWTFLVVPGEDGIGTVQAAAWTMVAIDVALTSAAIGLIRRTARSGLVPGIMLVGAAALICTADLVRATTVAGGSPSTVFVVLCTVGMLVVAFTPWTGGPDLFATSRPRPRTLRSSRVPHVIVGATCVLVVFDVVRGRTVDLALGLAGSSLILALVVQMAFLVRENVRLLSEVSAQAAKFRALVQGSSDVLMMCDRDGAMTYLSPAATRVFGFAQDGFTREELRALIHPDDRERVHGQVARLLEQGDGQTFLRCRIRDASGRWRHAASSVSLRREGGRVTGYVVNARDVTPQIELQRELEHRAHHDELTGLPNRRLFSERLDLRLGNELDGAVAVLFIDLDDFKAVNDSAGHAAGDALLIEAAGRLVSQLRDGDPVARFGGDEFAALVSGADPDAVLSVAGRLRTTLSAPYLVDGREAVVRASVGVAFATPGADAEELLRNADLAMYRAKATGRDRVEVYAPRLHAEVLHRVEMEQRLRHSLERGGLSLHYQPIVDLRSGRVTRMEALLRWPDEDGRQVPPAEFIPVAEQSGLIVALGGWVLETAIRQCAEWVAAGVRCGVSVNLSARQLEDPGLVRAVREVLTRNKLAPPMLTLEITENTLVENLEVSATRLAALRSLGVLVALDDFGTGFSSLAYLRQLPVDGLKIDRSFVGGLEQDGDGIVLTRTMLNLGRDLGLVTIAEGVERHEQLARLVAMGCVRGQGYLFAAPMPPEEVPAVVLAGFAGLCAAASPLAPAVVAQR